MTFPDVRLDERVVHLRVAKHPVRLASAHSVSCCWLPGGWEGLIATEGVLEVSGGRVQAQAMSEAPLIKLQVFFDMSEALSEEKPRLAPLPWRCGLSGSPSGNCCSPNCLSRRRICSRSGAICCWCWCWRFWAAYCSSSYSMPSANTGCS
jgi:hypothetical protein